MNYFNIHFRSTFMQNHKNYGLCAMYIPTNKITICIFEKSNLIRFC